MVWRFVPATAKAMDHPTDERIGLKKLYPSFEV